MLSYRHAFHAGNHADVLKHLCLFLTLRYFNRKDKPYWYIDTHAGAGLYDLSGEWAQKTGEHRNGISRLMAADNVCEPLSAFRLHLQDILLLANTYCGSPYLAASLLRAGDKMRLFEKHPADFPLLQQNMAAHNLGKRCIIQQSDGFSGLIALMPPATRRAVTLIDPSYETRNDYIHLSGCLKAALKRFADGCFLIWYPCLNKTESIHLAEGLSTMAPRYLHALLRVKDFDADGFGMAGSGMLVLNPPYPLAAELNAALPQLSKILAQTDAAGYTLDVQAA